MIRGRIGSPMRRYIMGEVSRLPGLFDGCFVRGNGSDLPRHDWDYEKE